MQEQAESAYRVRPLVIPRLLVSMACRIQGPGCTEEQQHRSLRILWLPLRSVWARSKHRSRRHIFKEIERRSAWCPPPQPVLRRPAFRIILGTSTSTATAPSGSALLVAFPPAAPTSVAFAPKAPIPVVSPLLVNRPASGPGSPASLNGTTGGAVTYLTKPIRLLDTRSGASDALHNWRWSLLGQRQPLPAHHRGRQLQGGDHPHRCAGSHRQCDGGDPQLTTGVAMWPWSPMEPAPPAPPRSTTPVGGRWWPTASMWASPVGRSTSTSGTPMPPTSSSISSPSSPEGEMPGASFGHSLCFDMASLLSSTGEGSRRPVRVRSQSYA